MHSTVSHMSVWCKLYDDTETLLLQLLQRMIPLLVLMASLLLKLTCCTIENVYCVTPTATSCSSCPQNSTHCAPLSEYAHKAQLYLTSNTTMVFLPGDYVLDTNFTVANISSLAMHGESSSGSAATVICNASVGFNFTGVLNFRISSLAFTLCSRSSLALTGACKYAMLLESIDYAELVNCSFHDNLGTALAVYNTNVFLAERNVFAHNHYKSSTPGSYIGGSCITALSSNLTFMGHTTFIENMATYYTGGIYVMNCNLNSTGSISFVNNSNVHDTNGDAGAIWASGSSLEFTGINNFTGNLAHVAGAIYTQNTALSFIGTSNFDHNHGSLAAVFTSNNVILSFSGTTNFISNGGGGICAFMNTSLLFHGTVNFTDNKAALWGGGLRLSDSFFSVLPNTTMYWKRNHARLGGAIYVTDFRNLLIYCSGITCTMKKECFFQLPGQNLSNGIDAQLIFEDNSADSAGSVLYGGAIDHCKLIGLGSYSSGEVFDRLVHIVGGNSNSSISSVPFRVCQCKHEQPICSIPNVRRTVYPGETFQVSVVAAGQKDGTVSASLTSHVTHGNLLGYQYFQFAYNTCTTLSYTVFPLSRSVPLVLELYVADPSGPCSSFGNKLHINLDINQNCPPGFNIMETEHSCVCEPRLQRYTNKCNITNGLGEITRDSHQHFWVGYDAQSHGLILHPHCPFDYCASHTVHFPLNNTDLQCSHSRSGLLCGACKTGYSLVLGTSQCKQCTNAYLLLLVPFALMGVALVFLLFVCKLTVASGTLSGLVFYANIVGINHTLFLPVSSTDTVSVFIAWLNLDFGVDTCFYNGMDAYSKTWLQFVFPVYVWVLVGLMILVSQFSDKFAKLLGSNPVSVLATLILLSYTKILHTLIAVVSITYLEYPMYYNRRVWLYDANIDYLRGKHIPLFLVAMIVFFFLFLPYTLLLVFGQWLQAMSHLRLFSWAKNARLKPFLDSYHGPYKSKHRYWPGLLLVLRFVLLLVFAFNPLQDPSITLVAIQVGTGVLQLWAWVSGGVYRNWCLDLLEGSFALNLIILAAATMYVNHSGGNQLAVGYTSVTTALLELIGILTYHIVKQLRHTELWKKISKLNINYVRHTEINANNQEEVEESNQLREPLLEDSYTPQLNYGTNVH